MKPEAAIVSDAASSKFVLSKKALTLAIGGVALSFIAGQLYAASQSNSSSTPGPTSSGALDAANTRFQTSNLDSWPEEDNATLDLLSNQSSQSTERSRDGRPVTYTLTPDGKLYVDGADNTNDEEDSDSDDDEDDSDDEEAFSEFEGEEIGRDIGEPLAQHLLVDLKYIDPDFLRSEARLRQATTFLIEEIDRKLQELTCLQNNQDGGYHCLGFMVDDRISIYTWPSVGWIVLDLYTRGPDETMHLVAEVEKAFAVPRPNEKKPFVNWAQKNRGLIRPGALQNTEEIEVDRFLLGQLKGYTFKKQIATVQTKFQTIDVFEAVEPKRALRRYDEESSSEEAPWGNTNVVPDRMVYLDSIMQSRLHGEAAYHEALVHPALFAHPNPKRVAIIGGGEGATLREVLKHKSVETVTMVEIDEGMVKASREHLPEWSDCSHLVGSAESCFDDPRAEVFYEDAIAWFIERFAVDKGDEVDDSMRYDVVIMDALDPSSVVEFSDILYGDDKFLGSLSNGVRENGILIAQVGEDDEIDEEPLQFILGEGFYSLVSHLDKGGFVSIRDYGEAHGGFVGNWGYMIAFKGTEPKLNWHDDPAQLQLSIRQRILPTHDGGSSLRFFDGGVMMHYTYPSPLTEAHFCLNEPRPEYCELAHGFDPSNPAGSALSATPSSSTSVESLMVLPKTTRLLSEMSGVTARGKTIQSYIENNGKVNNFYGERMHAVDTTKAPATRGGQNETTSISGQRFDSHLYNPFIDRNHMIFVSASDE